MSEIRLILDENSISHNKNEDIIYGNLYLKVGTRYFPDKNWNDYIYRILLTWAYNIINFNNGDLYFMDGAYDMSYTIKEEKIIIFIEEYGEFECILKEFLYDLITCLKGLKQYLQKNSLYVNGINRIEDCICKIEKKLK